MPVSFTPLVRHPVLMAPGGSERFRLKVLPAAGTSTEANGRSAVASAVPEPGVKRVCAGEPTIEVERVGERVERIRLRCSCGQTIELACEY